MKSSYWYGAAAAFIVVLSLPAQSQPAQTEPAQTQPDFLRQGRQLMQEGKAGDALALYQAILKSTPDSLPANNAAGSLLDWMGRSDEARKYFSKAIDIAPDAKAKAAAQRAMAMSWAFSGNCKKTVEFEQLVYQYYVTMNDFYQQGETADEAARVCIDAGDLDTAYQWYLTGHLAGLRQPDITADRKSLWEFRWEHAQARIAARKGNQTEADEHVKAARSLIEGNAEMAKGQARFLPYLAGYVAFYRGDYDTALSQLAKADQSDPFIQCMLGDTFQKLGRKEAALLAYRKAAATTSHNPSSAYARPYAARRSGPPESR
jgi:tetratricopeptide (TPR) repeat protein